MSPHIMLTLLLAAQTGGSDAAASREADMFGDASEPAPAAAADASGSREDAMFGEDAPATEGAASTPSMIGGVGGLLNSVADTTDIGGNLFLRLNGNVRDEQGITEAAMTSPSLFDAYMDARPNDRVRAFAQVRLNYDFTVQPGELGLTGQPQEPFRIAFDQGWVKVDLGRVAYITAGKQRIRWGTGRFWNPTDFINLDIRNSVDFFDQRLGVNLLKVHFPFEALGWNLYLLGKFEGIDVLDDTGVGARAEFVFGQMELALSSLVKKDAPLRIGGDFSAGLWLFDVRAEATVQRGLDLPRYKGELDFETGKLPEEQDTDDDWYANVVVGADIQLQYNDQDTLIIGGEYFYNQAGYASAELYPFLVLNGAFRPLYLGQHYFGAYILAAGPLSFNDTNLTLSTLGNLSDRSFLTRFDVQQVLLSWVTVNAFASVHYGNRGEFKLGIDIPPIPLVPALAEGFELPDDFLDLGVALRIEL
jgi:hypothetical protein